SPIFTVCSTGCIPGLTARGWVRKPAASTLRAMIPTLEWTSEGVRFLDQTKLPLEETYVLAKSYQDVADVITTMVVRGAPAIGVAAAMGVALGEKTSGAASVEELSRDMKQISTTLAATRPTAVNLFWAIQRMGERF